MDEHAAVQLAHVQQPGACGAGRRALQQALAHAAHRLLVAPAGASSIIFLQTIPTTYIPLPTVDSTSIRTSPLWVLYGLLRYNSPLLAALVAVRCSSRSRMPFRQARQAQCPSTIEHKLAFQLFVT